MHKVKWPKRISHALCVAYKCNADLYLYISVIFENDKHDIVGKFVVHVSILQDERWTHFFAQTSVLLNAWGPNKSKA